MQLVLTIINLIWVGVVSYVTVDYLRTHRQWTWWKRYQPGGVVPQNRRPNVQRVGEFLVVLPHGVEIDVATLHPVAGNPSESEIAGPRGPADKPKHWN